LSVESYEHLSLRRDLLLEYGPYGIPGLLLKVVPGYRISLTDWTSNAPVLITTDVAHAGNRLIDFASPSFTTLEKWMADGAAENNAPQVVRVNADASCSETLGVDAAFDASVDPATPDFAEFRDRVDSLIGKRCAASNCHGSPANSLHFTCGKTPEQTRWNYFAAGDYVSADAPQSDLLRRVLAPAAGGTYHEGGAIFSSSGDVDYQALLAWATSKGGPSSVSSTPEFSFFASRVQPMLVKRGCMMLGCHSAAMFHDYRLRGGSGGHFGLPATRKNYELSLEQLALESPDPNASRLIKKNLSPDQGGILHRGGPLFGARRPEDCDPALAESGPLDEQSPYCVISLWIAKERAARLGSALPLSGLVYVERAPRPGPDTPQDWATFAPGADLVQRPLTRAADATLTVGAETSLSRLCGLDPATSEVRRPAISWDGTRIAFAARSSANAPYRIFVVEQSSCAVDAAIDAAPVDDMGRPLPANEALIHNLDPAFAPDQRIVFLSTRGNVDNVSGFSYQGPQRTPADPSKLNTNLYVREPDGSIRQLTYVLNQEFTPSFMRDGRVIFGTEKRAPGFYQLAARRINLDGADYHPLFGQRSTIGFNQFTSVVELSDKNLAAIVSQRGAAHGAGALMIVNRSLGIDQGSSNEADYLIDAAARGYPDEAFYQHSMRIVDPAASGRLDQTSGAYFAPSALPDGRLLVSYAANVVQLADFSGDFDIVVVDPETGARTPLVTGAEDALWPAAIYARQNLGVFRSRLDEANGATLIDPERGDRSEVTFLDLPVFASLLFQNTRTGRKLPTSFPGLEVWESLPPEAGVTDFASGSAFVTRDVYGDLYVRRSHLGTLGPLEDGSARLLLRGGMPLVLAATVEFEGEAAPSLHFQREEMQFYPGEVARQAFRRRFFDNLCGGCHGSISGRELDVAVNPDILTQASDVMAKRAAPTDLTQAAPGTPRGPDFP
jgi:hypothetical protein